MALRNEECTDVTPSLADVVSGRGDPAQKYRIYRLCVCEQCEGTGSDKDWIPAKQSPRCDACRGEGKVLDLVATAADPAGVGVALIRLADEGEFEGCPVGILEDGSDWLIKPWLPSPRNISDAARVMAKSKGRK